MELLYRLLENIEVNNIASIINKAKQYITTFGWIKGDYGNPTIGFCIVGALRAAVDVTDNREYGLPSELNEAYKIFTEPLKVRGFFPYRYTSYTAENEILLVKEPFADAACLVDLNDETYASKEEIIKLFDEALEEASKAV